MRPRSSTHRDDAIDWALTTDGPVTLAEAEARLVRSHPKLARALLTSHRKRKRANRARTTSNRNPGHRKAPADPVRPGVWGQSWGHWGVRRRALWIVLLLLPVIAVLYVPSRHARSAASADLFFDVTFVTYLAAALLQAALLVGWLVRALAWEMTRFLSAWLTVAMVFVLPLLLVTVGTLRRSDDWLLHTIPFPLAAGLAAANLWTTFSGRTRRLHDVADVAWFQHLLRDPEPMDTTGPRGPARELRRTIRRLSTAEQQTLAQRCGTLLQILHQRGLISSETAERAVEAPLGRWHHLDGDASGLRPDSELVAPDSLRQV